MKKIFCIFSVVLILIMATVPCFAQSRFYNQLAEYYSVDGDFSSNGWFYEAHYTFRLIPDHVYYFVDLLPSDYSDYNISFRNGYDYSFIQSRFLGSSVSLNSQGNFVIYLLTTFSDKSAVNSAFEHHFILSANFVDGTAIYGPGNEPSYDQFLLDFPIFNEYVAQTSQALYYDGFFDNVLTFFSHLPESFTHFANIFEYTDLYIFLAAIFSILFVLFLVFMVIRRCRNL